MQVAAHAPEPPVAPKQHAIRTLAGLALARSLLMNRPMQHIGPYVVDRKLSEGGMAEVLLAHRAGHSMRVVLKHVLEAHADDPDFTGMLRREASVAATLDHPNVVQVHDFVEQQGKPYLVMEFLDGRNLREMLKRAAEKGRRLSPEVACRIVADMLAGLAYAHARTDAAGRPLGLVHRDVTPSNVVVTWSGAVKLIDFGIAKAMHQHGAELTRAGQFKGKCAYMSPEQLRGATLDHRADLFSAGIVLWESLTTRRLFARRRDIDTLRAICEENVPPPSSHVPELPPALDAICARALARAPEARYQDAGEMRADLVAIMHAMGWSASSDDVEQELHALFDDEEPAKAVGRETGTTTVIAEAPLMTPEDAGEGLYAEPTPPLARGRVTRLVLAAMACFAIGALGTAALSAILR